MYPYRSSESAALYGECGPGLAAIGVAFVCGGGAEGECETDYETQDCEEDVGYVDWECLVSKN